MACRIEKGLGRAATWLRRKVSNLFLTLFRDIQLAIVTLRSNDPPIQARALAYFADLASTLPLARDCFIQLNANHPLDGILRSSINSSHRRHRSDGEVEQAGNSAAEYADKKRGRLSALHSGRRHWTTVETLVKRCKACMEADNEVTRMCGIVDGSLPMSTTKDAENPLKLKVVSPDDALIGVIGYLR